MLKCANCGTLVQDGKTVCGVCGSTRLLGTEQIRQPSSLAAPRRRRGRWIAIFVLTVTLASLAGGFAIIALWIDSIINSVVFFGAGILMVLFSIAILLEASGGPGGGAREYLAGRRAKSQRLGTELGQKDREGKEPDD